MASPVLALGPQEAKKAPGATFIMKIGFRAKKNGKHKHKPPKQGTPVPTGGRGGGHLGARKVPVLVNGFCSPLALYMSNGT